MWCTLSWTPFSYTPPGRVSRVLSSAVFSHLLLITLLLSTYVSSSWPLSHAVLATERWWQLCDLHGLNRTRRLSLTPRPYPRWVTRCIHPLPTPQQRRPGGRGGGPDRVHADPDRLDGPGRLDMAGLQLPAETASRGVLLHYSTSAFVIIVFILYFYIS